MARSMDDDRKLTAMMRANRTYQQMADALGVPIGTVASRIRAARRDGVVLPGRRRGPRRRSPAEVAELNEPAK